MLLTFFPHCFTGGSESHFASLQSVARAMAEDDTQILAVSTGDAPSIEKFARQLRPSFLVPSDQNRKTSLSYGAAQNDRQLAARMSVLIDKTGMVRYVDTDVNVPSHGAEILAKIKELGLATP